jgi:probable rRNA maturation factor
MSPAPRRRTRRLPATDSPSIDIVVQSPLWNAERGIKAVLRRAVAEAATSAKAAAKNGELAIVLTDDAAIRALNRHWRRQDKPTNVLSFPATASDHALAGSSRRNGAPRHLGDIVIAYQTTAREAKAEHKPFRHHLAHLAVHGFLHLLGYDHEADAEAQAMEGLEIAVLARIRVPNPYVARERADATTQGATARAKDKG